MRLSTQRFNHVFTPEDPLQHKIYNEACMFSQIPEDIGEHCSVLSVDVGAGPKAAS